MREIKFRAWDTVDNKMRYENDVEGTKDYLTLLAIGFHGLPIAITEDSFSENEIVGWNRDHNLKLMQYTGLKDKTGKEIFEGDIIEGIAYDGSFISKGEINYTDCSYKVDFHEGSAIGFYYLHHIRLDTIKVIGNVFEHPHLLKEESQ